VRHACEARLNRSTYAQLIDHALEQADEGDQLAVVSRNARFVLGARG
jgi:uncharacterized protein